MTEGVLPDGPPARRAATSWRMYLFWVDRLLCPPVGLGQELSNAATGTKVTKWPLHA